MTIYVQRKHHNYIVAFFTCVQTCLYAVNMGQRETLLCKVQALTYHRKKKKECLTHGMKLQQMLQTKRKETLLSCNPCFALIKLLLICLMGIYVMAPAFFMIYLPFCLLILFLDQIADTVDTVYKQADLQADINTDNLECSSTTQPWAQ